MATKRDKEYEAQVLQWQAEKYNSRIRENGWLALAGLYWLKQGRNLLGSNPMCEVTLPERAPTFLGIVELKGDSAHFQAAEGVPVKVNGRAIKKTDLRSSQDASPSFITWDDMRLVLHEHAGKHAIRVWDNRREERRSLPPLKWFPINKSFRVPARYIRYPEPRFSSSLDAFGEAMNDRMDGYVTFKLEDKTCKLDVSEMEDHTLFIKFRDETSKKETYPSGRYYYTEPVGENGRLFVDFNYSYSPPCAFTPYATCTFAPPQNILPLRVEAGEIYKE